MRSWISVSELDKIPGRHKNGKNLPFLVETVERVRRAGCFTNRSERCQDGVKATTNGVFVDYSCLSIVSHGEIAGVDHGRRGVKGMRNKAAAEACRKGHATHETPFPIASPLPPWLQILFSLQRTARGGHLNAKKEGIIMCIVPCIWTRGAGNKFPLRRGGGIRQTMMLLLLINTVYTRGP